MKIVFILSFQSVINYIESNYNHDHNFDIEQQQKYQKIIEENYQSILTKTILKKSFYEDKIDNIWHEVCSNRDIKMVQFIYSLKGVDANQMNNKGENGFLIACEINSLKVIKYIHKNTSSNIHLINTSKLNAFQLAVKILYK